MTSFTYELLDRMPVSLALVDHHGIIRFANDRAASLLDTTADELVGTGAFELLGLDDAPDRILDLRTPASADGLPVSGPIPVRFATPTGRRSGQLWATRIIDDPLVSGYIFVVIEAATRDDHAEAVRRAASGEPLDRVLAVLGESVTKHPLMASGEVLRSSGRRVSLITSALADPLATETDESTPWGLVLEQGGSRYLESLRGLPSPVRGRALAAGFASVWCHELMGGPEPVTLVLWRRVPGTPGPNQLHHLNELADIARLAAERAAPLAGADPLTGTAQRPVLDNHEALADRFGLALVHLAALEPLRHEQGQAVAEQVLVATARRLRRAVRSDDLVIRFDSDTFALLCHGLDGPELASTARRLVDHLDPPVVVDGRRIDTGVLVGAAISPGGDQPAALVDAASRALAEARSRGVAYLIDT